MAWMISGMITVVKELWYKTDKCEISDSKWHGWLMTFMTNRCFPSMKIKTDFNSPFKAKYLNSYEKILKKLKMDNEYEFDYMKIADFFEDHENVSVLFNSNILNQEDTHSISNLYHVKKT